MSCGPIGPLCGGLSATFFLKSSSRKCCKFWSFRFKWKEFKAHYSINVRNWYRARCCWNPFNFWYFTNEVLKWCEIPLTGLFTGISLSLGTWRPSLLKCLTSARCLQPNQRLLVQLPNLLAWSPNNAASIENNLNRVGIPVVIRASPSLISPIWEP